MKQTKTEKERLVIKKQTYTISLTYFDDGTIVADRINDGFNAMELLGYLERVQIEIVQQMNGVIKPTRTKRKFVEK